MRIDENITVTSYVATGFARVGRLFNQNMIRANHLLNQKDLIRSKVNMISIITQRAWIAGLLGCVDRRVVGLAIARFNHINFKEV